MRAAARRRRLFRYSLHQHNEHMPTPSPSSETTVRHPSEGMITLAHVIYALHAFSALTGLASSVLVLTAFLTGWPSIIAVILNYAKRSEVRGTWLDSHFGWQIRTFWYALLWLFLGGVAFVTMVGIPVALAVWRVTGLWVLYRIARGWMTLASEKPMPLAGADEPNSPRLWKRRYGSRQAAGSRPRHEAATARAAGYDRELRSISPG